METLQNLQSQLAEAERNFLARLPTSEERLALGEWARTSGLDCDEALLFLDMAALRAYTHGMTAEEILEVAKDAFCGRDSKISGNAEAITDIGVVKFILTNLMRQGSDLLLLGGYLRRYLKLITEETLES